MNVLLIYFMLNGLGQWEFLMIERVPAQDYCQALQHDVASVYDALPGNFKIVCTNDERIEI
jgi:hypothetical protein